MMPFAETMPAPTEREQRAARNRGAKRSMAAEKWFRVLVYAAMAAGGVWLLLAAMEPCATGALCAVAAMPTRQSWWGRLRGHQRRLYLTGCIADVKNDLHNAAESLIWAEHEVRVLPGEIAALRLRVDVFEIELRDIELLGRVS